MYVVVYSPILFECLFSLPLPTGRHFETPFVANHYPIAQLNHYWTLSYKDFLRFVLFACCVFDMCVIVSF
jgi:hypothetical protein